MKCFLCETDCSRTVWRQNGSRIERCGICGVLFMVNPPSQVELVRLYDEGSLIGTPTESIGRNDGPPPVWKQREHLMILERITRLEVREGTLLDVGCFDGMFLRNAQQAGFDVMGVEPMWEAYHYAHDVRGLPVVHGTLETAALPAERFVAASMLDVIEHVMDPVSELREVHRVLKPGGVLVLTTPNSSGLLQCVVGTKRKILGQSWCPIDDVPWHIWGFTPRAIRRCLEKAGFFVEAVEALEPSPLTTNENGGSKRWKRFALCQVAKASKILHMSDRMMSFARKVVADRT